MTGYSFGNRIRTEVFGGSHDPYIGAFISGMPEGFQIDIKALASFMKRRSSTGEAGTTKRKEKDEVLFLSGVKDGVTTGETIEIRILNTDVKTSDYDRISHVPRPGHADLTAWIATGSIPQGGGAFSGRMTALLCAAGGICLQLLEKRGIVILSHLLSVGSVSDGPLDPMEPVKPLYGPGVYSEEVWTAMKEEIEKAGNGLDSVGGVIECAVTGFPAGHGGALSLGLEGAFAKNIFAVPAVKGIEFGSGFEGSRMRGSENNDGYRMKNGKLSFLSNNAGGILGGISTGMPLVFRTAVKPTPSIGRAQLTVDLETMEDTVLETGGRHDTCIAVRALPVIEAVCAMTLCDILEEKK